jgi:hypothetical protein
MPELTDADGFEITPSAIPKTREHALALAQAWGRTLSHWNDCATTAPDRATAIPLAAQADAAEVQRLCALAAVLPTEAEFIPEIEAMSLVPVIGNYTSPQGGAGAVTLYVPKGIANTWKGPDGFVCAEISVRIVKPESAPASQWESHPDAQPGGARG